ncbi:hypothetical protein ASF83_17655 [Plantibacter sp. Leaf171]|uniref:hypothetical protein n=1 Tax=unclassified Plantibacter TaxID=2624265 RepID=UPI000701CD88|nr:MULTISPECIES: hypothetical protein [unclassified Plantibacter]KQM13552.1 hypothetical protein ASE44_17670 [Plantibacter sp. Leaf1]KQR56661.1 hypothetical protein ASF83_17655 [Plantibacter sp. Leaf171]
MKKLPIVAAVTFIALGLAGCTATGSTGPTESSASASASAEAGSDYVVPEIDGSCVDGTATIAEDSSNITLEGDCENVVVERSNSMVTITGVVSNLTVNSSISLVKVTEVATVAFGEGADGNKVVTPSTPAVTDGGQDNLVAAE